MGLLCQRKIYRMSHYRLFSVGVLFLLSVVSVPHVWAQQTLENPQPDSFQSGIGIISGWACNARRIEIAFNGGAPQAAAYGTSRGDTRQVCGDTDNGFGLLYNWNLLGDGVHTVVAYADGVEFASTTVIVTTLGEAFLRGVSDSYTISDFPDPGATRTLRWQEAQQNFVISAGSSQGGGTSGRPPRVLENPPPGSYQSGIGIISGWVCDAQRVELTFDGGSPQEAAYGTPRGDTRQVCGDTDNGFGLLYNWNLLGAGSHHVVAYADGVEFARVDVTVTTLGAEFRRGLSGREIVTDFPEVGTDIRIHWQEAQQNFVISAAFPTLRLVAVDPYILLPNDIRIPNITVSSFLSETAEVRASPKPTLLVAEDAAGPVLLALANMDGGGGRGPGSVAVDLDSTAITLVGLTAGIAVSDMTPSIVDVIVYHQQYPALVADLTRRMRADKNFLARLYDSPETERLLQEVAEPLTIAAIPQAVGASSSSQGSRSYATDIDASRSTEPPGALTQTAGVGAECGQTPGDSIWNDPGLRDRIQKHALTVADIAINLSNNRKLGEDLADLRIHKETIDACERSQQRQWLRNNPDKIDIFDGVAGLQLKLPDLLRETLIYRQAVPGFQQACRDIHRVPEQQLSPTEQAFTFAAIIPINKILRALPWMGPLLGKAWEAKQRNDAANARKKLIDDIIETIEECGQEEEEEPKEEEEEEEPMDEDDSDADDDDADDDDADDDDDDSDDDDGGGGRVPGEQCWFEFPLTVPDVRVCLPGVWNSEGRCSGGRRGGQLEYGTAQACVGGLAEGTTCQWTIECGPRGPVSRACWPRYDCG